MSNRHLELFYMSKTEFLNFLPKLSSFSLHSGPSHLHFLPASLLVSLLPPLPFSMCSQHSSSKHSNDFPFCFLRGKSKTLTMALHDLAPCYLLTSSTIPLGYSAPATMTFLLFFEIFLDHSHLRDFVHFVLLFPSAMHAFLEIAAWFVFCLLTQVSHHNLSGIPFLTTLLTVGSPVPHISYCLPCFVLSIVLSTI